MKAIVSDLVTPSTGIARRAGTLGAQRVAGILIVALLMAATVASARADHWPATKIVIDLNHKERITVRRTTLEAKENGRTWRGEIEETGEPVMLMWWKDGRFGGIFAYRGDMYALENLKSVGGEVHATVATNPGKTPPHHAAMRPHGDDPLVARSLVAQREGAMMRRRERDRPNLKDQRDAAGGSALQKPETTPGASNIVPANVMPISLAKRQAMAAKKITIDVMVLYTSKVGSEYVDIETDLIEHSIVQANLSFVNSGIGNIKLRLVHSREIGYDETGSEHFDHLYRMVDGVGAFAKVRTLRNEKRADVVVLIVDDASGCGLATRVAADSEEAFAIVHHTCAALTYSVPHEIGHIIGTRHDRSLDHNTSPFPYGHGYVNGTKWRDIMSYKASCGGCPRLPVWSSPKVMIKGEPAGTAELDNARVISEQAARVAAFR